MKGELKSHPPIQEASGEHSSVQITGQDDNYINSKEKKIRVKRMLGSS